MGMNLTQNDVQQLMSEGYSINEINEAVREVEQEDLQSSYNQTMRASDPRALAQQSAFSPVNQENLIKWQLELDNILERAEHILRGDVLIHKSGHLIWEKQQNPENQILNDYGVQEVMRILSMYLNRNTILSDYEQEEIDLKLLDFGRELNDLFFMKYEEMGLSVNFEDAFRRIFKVGQEFIVITEVDNSVKVGTYNNRVVEYVDLSDEQIKKIKFMQHQFSLEKRKNYPILMREIVDIVHSSYKRALTGGERRSLREARSVTQTEPLGQMQGMGMQQQGGGRTRGILNPMRYLIGKNK